jgi:hypothetical protein
MPWPPIDEDEQARLKDHKANRLLCDEAHEEIFPQYAKYLAYKHFDEKKQKIVLGWAETATTNYMDLLLGESPKIECPEVYDLPDEEIFIYVSR